MIENRTGRGRALRIVIGITMLFLMMAGGASAVKYIDSCASPWVGAPYVISSPGE